MLFLQLFGQNFLRVKIRRQFYRAAQVVRDGRFPGAAVLPISRHDIELMPDDLRQRGMTGLRLLLRKRKHFIIQTNRQRGIHGCMLPLLARFGKEVETKDSRKTELTALPESSLREENHRDNDFPRSAQLTQSPQHLAERGQSRRGHARLCAWRSGSRNMLSSSSGWRRSKSMSVDAL